MSSSHRKKVIESHTEGSENKREGLNINGKKTECTGVSKTSSKRELQIGGTKIKCAKT